jgi:hypothetical protein
MIQTNVARGRLPFDPKMMYTFHQILEGIYDHQLQIPRNDTSCRCSSFDGIWRSICWLGFILPSLQLQSQCWAKDNSFAKFRPTQGCTTWLSIEYLKSWHLDALLIDIIIWELGKRKMSILLQTVAQETSLKHIFNDLIYSLCLTISLRMISRASNKKGAKTFMKLFLEIWHKDRSSVRYDGL